MVSIAGGEPLLHPEIDRIVAELVAAQGLRLPVHQRRAAAPQARPLHAVPLLLLGGAHGRPERAPRRGRRPGRRVRRGRGGHRARPRQRGFRVTTNSTFFNTDSPKTVRDVLDFLNDDLKVDAMMISPAYAYEKAPDQEHFLGVEQTRELFHEAFADGRRKKWRLNHSPLFLDFLEGKADFQCTAWGIPSYSVLRLAEALLPDGGRLRKDLQRARRDDRLGRLRPGQ